MFFNLLNRVGFVVIACLVIAFVCGSAMLLSLVRRSVQARRVMSAPALPAPAKLTSP